MPPLPNTPSPVIKFNVHWNVDGDPLAQTIHYMSYSGSAPGSADLAALAAATVANGNTHLASVCSTHIGMSGCKCTDVSVTDRKVGEGGSPWVGTESGGMLAPGTAAIASYLIDRSYRGGKPRNYFPFGTSADIATTGLWAGASVTNFETALAAWQAEMEFTSEGATTVENFVNVSYYHGFTVVTSPTTGRARNIPTKRTTPIVDAIVGTTIRTQIGSQRRRNRDA